MKEHYMKVERYIQAVKESSPGTTTQLVVDTSKQTNSPIFQRLYTCFEGVKQGWKEGCRKVICVDAAFLKTFLGGQILSAVARDPNEQMYPIAWATAEVENNSSWTWFITHLQTDLELADGTGIAIISDEHQINLEELRELNPDAATAFTLYNPKLFCRAYLNSDIKTDTITSNMVETFNSYIINSRTKHLIYMLEDIRVTLMQRLVTKRQEMQKSTSLLCPRIQANLERKKRKAAFCYVLPSTGPVFNPPQQQWGVDWNLTMHPELIPESELAQRVEEAVRKNIKACKNLLTLLTLLLALMMIFAWSVERVTWRRWKA